MAGPKICAVIVDNDPPSIQDVEGLVDMFEVRIDRIGEAWRNLVGRLGKPWIACNRPGWEGGIWKGDEAGRIALLAEAVDLGAALVDLELNAPNLVEAMAGIKGRATRLLSFHDFQGTPEPGELSRIVQRQLNAGADICKVVTTARKAEDNDVVLGLFQEFPGTKLVAFAMGPLGTTSRFQSLASGCYLTYGSIKEGKESAPGQVTVKELREYLSRSYDI